MRKVNLKDVKWEERQSPKGKFGRRVKNISVALGRDPESLDLMKRWPFDLALVAIPKGKMSSAWAWTTAWISGRAS